MKTITGTLVVLVLLFFFLYSNERKQRDNYIEQITELATSNKHLRENISERDKDISQKTIYIASLNDSIETLHIQLKTKQVKYIQLEAIYGTLQAEVTKIPIEESYRTLDEDIYNYEGEKKYPFNQLQVQGIHLTFLQWRQQNYMLGNLKEQISYYAKEVNLHESVNKELQGTISIMQENRVDLETTIVNKDILIYTHQQQIRRERRRKVIWQVATGLAVGAAIVL